MVNRPKFVYFFCIFLTLYHLIARVGLATDLQWHLDVGRDRMLTPPHLMILGGFPICVVLSCFTSSSTRETTGRARTRPVSKSSDSSHPVRFG